jgi:RimJ/RimL family protein N-acetyltransferase
VAVAEKQSSSPIRVELRQATIDDAPLLRRWRAEGSARRFQPLHDVSTAQLRADLATQRHSDLYRARGERFLWIIEANRRPAGWITLVIANWEHGLSEVGYTVSQQFQGNGIMTQALTLLLPELFLRTPIERIEARCAVNNHASQRVLEKLGFVKEGTLRSYFVLHGERVDHFIFGLLARDYLPALDQR